jgi:hypothetical protein
VRAIYAPIVVAVFTLAACPAAAQGPRVRGEAEVKAGGFARLSVEGAGKTVLWTVTPQPIQDEEISGELVFTGERGTEYVATAIVIDFDAKTATKLKHTVRFLGVGPGPSPPPGPGPEPVPPVPPAPVGVVKFLVVIEETGMSAASRGVWFADKALTERLKAKGIKVRIGDKDVVDADGKPPADLAGYIRAAAGKPLPRLFVVDEAGRVLYQAGLPEDPTTLLKLLERFGG